MSAGRPAGPGGEWRAADLRITAPAARGRRVVIRVDGHDLGAHEGESVAAALLAAGHRALRATASGAPRGYFCGMGVCHDCLVTIDGLPDVRACVTPVRDGMRVETAGPALPGR